MWAPDLKGFWKPWAAMQEVPFPLPESPWGHMWREAQPCSPVSQAVATPAGPGIGERAVLEAPAWSRPTRM